jgi:fatty acid synthase subunit alpha, fungi type
VFNATDLSDMTYEEMVLRMIKLMFVSYEKRWVDHSLRNLTGDWLRRVEERFAGVNGGGVKPSLLQNFSSLNDPLPFVKSFETYPLTAEDTAYFLAISQRPGQKPVPFIPVLDASFEVWFKKVSFDMFSSDSLLMTIILGFLVGCRRYRSRFRPRPSACVSFKDL